MASEQGPGRGDSGRGESGGVTGPEPVPGMPGSHAGDTPTPRWDASGASGQAGSPAEPGPVSSGTTDDPARGSSEDGVEAGTAAEDVTEAGTAGDGTAE
ncbi:MAG TPA: hypothetical protein VIQ30_14955, partial [Pseudonocardia sp.]